MPQIDRVEFPPDAYADFWHAVDDDPAPNADPAPADAYAAFAAACDD